MSASVPRVLFVDDEPRVLSGLKMGFWRFRDEWEAEFEDSGAKALERLATESFDAIVSDMRMPGMDGEALLRRVQKEYPDMVRVVLSGQTDRDVAARMVHIAHQFLAKPCDVTVICERLRQAVSPRPEFGHPSVRALVSGLGQLQVIASVKDSLAAAFEREPVALDPVAELVLQDSALCAKVLQIAGSAFFGPPRQLGALSAAVRALGTDSLRAALGSAESLPASAAEQLRLQAMASAIAAVSHCIAVDVGVDPSLALAAGLLSTLGARILCTYLGDRHVEVRQQALQRGASVQAVELERFGTTHSEVGAYLAGLWGLDAVLVTALAAQSPRRSEDLDPGRLPGLLRVACALVEDASDAPLRYFSPVDAGALPPASQEWRAIAESAAAASRRDP
jgi:HD-like signal output (HDOD) protein/ActR/RegA family two-component response regulator